MPIDRAAADWNTQPLTDAANDLASAGNGDVAKVFRKLNVLLADLMQRLGTQLGIIATGDIFNNPTVIANLGNAIDVTEQITKTVTATDVILGHSAPLTSDPTHSLAVSSATYNGATHVITFVQYTKEEDPQGHGKAVATGSTTSIDLDDFIGGGGGSAVDLWNNKGTLPVVVTGATFINIPTTNGSNAILAFASNSTGGDLKLLPGSAANDLIHWTGSAWAIFSPTYISGITIKNNTTVILSGATSLAILTATVPALAFGGSGTAGTLGFTGGATYKVLQYDGSAYGFDYARFH